MDQAVSNVQSGSGRATRRSPRKGKLATSQIPNRRESLMTPIYPNLYCR